MFVYVGGEIEKFLFWPPPPQIVGFKPAFNIDALL